MFKTLRFSKTIFVISVLVVAALLFRLNTSSAKALTAQEIQAQIAKFQAQIAQLQQQLKQIQGGQPVWCHNFSVNLGYGDRFGDVGYLQTALEKEGFTISTNEKETNTFGMTTASAVVQFQEKYADNILKPWHLRTGTGYVGKTTRAKLNELYGCHVTTPPQKKFIKVISPNGGEKWVMGNTYDITWESEGLTKNIEIYIQDDRAGPSYKLIATGISNLRHKYSWKIPKNFWGPYTVGDAYKILVRETGAKVWNGGTFDKSDNYFSIVAPSTTTCTDSDGGKNYYVKGATTNVIREDGTNIGTSTDVCLKDNQRALPGQEDILFEGYCDEQGIGRIESYHCPYGCKDGACVKAPEKSITVLSPNGGEKWVIGSTHKITWTSKGVNKVLIELDRGNQGWHLAYNVDAALGEYKWTISNSVTPADDYKIKIIGQGDAAGVEDASNNYFSIVAPSTPFISLVSPWKGPANTAVKIYGRNLNNATKIEFYQNGRLVGSQRSGSQSVISVSSDGTELHFTLSSIIVANLGPGTYQIRVLTPAGLSNAVSFTITTSPIESCTDSDGGKNYYVKGSLYQSEEAYQYKDYCVNGKVLREFWCMDSGQAGSEYYTCPYGCKDGACIKEPEKKPDLTITDLTFSPTTNLEAGDALYGYVTLKNIGNAPVSNIELVLRDQKGWGNSTIISSPYSLYPDHSLNVTIKLTVSPVHFTYNPHNFVAQVYSNGIEESNESNNKMTKSIILGEAQKEDPVSGTLSVNKTTVTTGEDIELTIMAGDLQGVKEVEAWYQGSWHTQYCGGGISCQKSWTVSESTPGAYTYYGYVYGTKLNGNAEGSYTEPVSVTVTVIPPKATAERIKELSSMLASIQTTIDSLMKQIQGLRK